MDLKILKQITIEDKYNKKEINKHIWRDIENTIEIQGVIEKLRNCLVSYMYGYADYWPSKKTRVITLLDYNAIDDLVAYIATATMKTMGMAVPIQGIVEGVARKLEGYNDYMDAVRTASEIIAVGALSDLYDTIAAKDSETGSLMLRSRWRLDLSTQQHIADTLYLPPLITPPNPITCNTDSGYFNPPAESLVLKKYNHHSYKLAYDAINYANSTPLELDEFILDNYEELPTKPLDTKQKAHNFMLLKNSSKRVYRLLIENDNEFWFSHRYDKRGRMYIQGYHVNLQSTEYKKALINLKEKECVELTRSK